ncbi:MAG: hypothetical protein U0V87_03940 [Acidobacteriota bacterium]
MALWKKLLVGCIALSLAFGSTAVLAGAYAAHEISRGVETGDFGEHGFGSLHVFIHEKHEGGTRLGLRFPAFLVRFAVRVAPLEIPEDSARELRPHLPLLRAIAEEFRNCPDGVFVEVRSARESISISKQGDVLSIHVDDENDEVRLDVPMSCVRTVVAKLEHAAKRA